MLDDVAGLTHSGVLRRLLYEGLESLGLDPVQIYRQAYPHLPLSPPNSQERRPHDMAPYFWQALPALSGDADIGLHLGEVMRPRPLDVVSYLQQASRNLQEALEVFVRYQHIISGGFAAGLRVEGDSAVLILDLDYLGHGSLRQQMECLALLFCKHLQQLCEGQFQLTAVTFRHAAPARTAEHRRLFGLLPQFAASHDALWFPAALLSRPSRNAAPAIFAVLGAHADAQLAELQGNTLRNRVLYWLACQLGEGECSLAACAAALGQERVALQRSLAAQGQGFRPLLDEVRRQRAQQLLLQGLSIREVARGCGFVELSPFYRAFRRWWGCTPQQLQRQHAAG